MKILIINCSPVRNCATAENDEASQVIIAKIFDGVDEKSLMNTIQTILKMEKNLEKI